MSFGGGHIITGLGYRSFFLTTAGLTLTGALIYWVYFRVPRGELARLSARDASLCRKPAVEWASDAVRPHRGEGAHRRHALITEQGQEEQAASGAWAWGEQVAQAACHDEDGDRAAHHAAPYGGDLASRRCAVALLSWPRWDRC